MRAGIRPCPWSSAVRQMRGTYPEPQAILRFLDCLRPWLILPRAGGSADLPDFSGPLRTRLSIDGDNMEAVDCGIVTVPCGERQTAKKGMAGDEQIVRRWRPPRRPEADIEFPCELGHRGSERVHIDGRKEVMYARPLARIRRPFLSPHAARPGTWTGPERRSLSRNSVAPATPRRWSINTPESTTMPRMNPNAYGCRLRPRNVATDPRRSAATSASVASSQLPRWNESDRISGSAASRPC